MQRNKILDLSTLDVVGSARNVEIGHVVESLQSYHKHYRDARQALETMWSDYYTNYLTTSSANHINITTASMRVGVEKTWRHNVKAPVGFQTVETLVAYFMGAIFPNDRWFNFRPVQPIDNPNFRQIIELNRRYLSEKLSIQNFEQQTEIVLRECCIAGTAAILHPWANGNINFKALSPFDFYLDPDEPNAQQANLIRPYSLSIPEYLNYVDSGLFNLCTKEEAKAKNNYSPAIDKEIVKNLSKHMGIEYLQEPPKKQSVELYEFWGDLHIDKEQIILKNVRATWNSEGVLLNLDSNPFQVRPVSVMTYIETSRSPYGIGALQAVSSQIFYRDVLTSRNADNTAISSDAAILYRPDAVLDPDDLKIRPGAKIPVTDPSGIQPLKMSFPNGMSIQEMAMSDSMIDRAVGTGAFIGVDRGRDADRVTAEEVAAQREAGGKRLSVVYSHINKTWLLPLLNTLHEYCQKFETETTTVNYGDVFIGISPEAIQFPMKAVAMGAVNVADREYNLRQLLQWVELVGNTEQFASMVNWEAILEEITSLMIPEVSDRVLGAQPVQAEQVQPSAMQQLEEAVRFSQGQPGVNSLNAAQQNGTLGDRVVQQVETLQGR